MYHHSIKGYIKTVADPYLKYGGDSLLGIRRLF